MQLSWRLSGLWLGRAGCLRDSVHDGGHGGGQGDDNEDRHQFRCIYAGVRMLVRLRAGAGCEGDLLSELQDGAGFNCGDMLQRQRAEDKGEGDVRVFVMIYSGRTNPN